MITSSLILLLIAIYFLRQQISPLKTLSKAADAFGKGDEFFPIKERGSTEVRNLTRAFLDMRERIRLYIEQRTEMLTGISHDLRTPLTRMKLQIAMLNQKDAKDGLTEDVVQMEDMIEAYLSFIKEKEEEGIKKIDISKLIGDIILDAKRNGDIIRPNDIELVEAEIRVGAVRRAITNLTSNACREGKNTEISLKRSSKHALYYRMPGIKIISPMTPKEYLLAYNYFMKNNDVLYVSEHRGSYSNKDELSDFISKDLDIILFPISITRFEAQKAKIELEKKGYKIGIGNIVWIKPYEIKKEWENAVKSSKFGGIVLDDDYPQGVAANLAYEMMKKTGKKIDVLGLKNKSAGFSKATDNLPPSYLEIVEKVEEIVKTNRK